MGGAILIGGDLHGIHLANALLGGARLDQADLHGADLSGADLREASLIDANLSDAQLIGADLRGASVRRADLRRAWLGLKMHGADFHGANLNRAHLHYSDLSEADLSGADLSEADVSVAVLAGADLAYTELRGAYLASSDLSGVNFEPASLPDIRGIAAAQGLENVRYLNNPDALAQLAKQFQELGFRGQERRVVYAMKRSEAARLLNSCIGRMEESRGKFSDMPPPPRRLDCLPYGFSRVFFDLPCQYGMNPGRPLVIAGGLWFFFAIVYALFMNDSGRSGIYLVGTLLRRGSAHRQGYQLRIRCVADRGPETPRWKYALLYPFRWLRREWRVVRIAMYFSLMATFNIGFHEIDFGKWLRMLSKREYDPKAVGWARTVSGLQSLLSVYLIALWVLTYFGRPFQ